MNDKKYYERALQDLETELKQQKKFLTNLRGLSRQCEAQDTKSDDTLPALVAEWQARKNSVEQAIEQVKAKIK